MKRPFFSVVQAKAGEAGRINIYGVVGDWWEGNTAENFVRQFASLERQHDRINVHINSPGGSVWDLLPIFNTIKASEKEVHTYVDGIAYSAGAMIALAPKKGRVHMAKGSLMMIHNVSWWTHGNAKKLREDADVLDKHDDVLGQLIADRTGLSLDEVKATYMDFKDHFLTPEEAKAAGLIDFIEDYQADEAPDNVRNMTHGQVAAWYNERMEEPSQSFMDKVMDNIRTLTGVGKDSKPENMFGNKFSKLTALAKVAAANVTAEQVEAVNTEIAEAQIEGVTLVLDTELEQVNNNLTTAQNRVTELETQATADKTTIQNLQVEVAKLKGTPAADATSPTTDKDDTIPTGEEEKEADNFRTSVDEEYEQIWGK